MEKLDCSIANQAVHLCGVDEVGRGCLAGPVYAGAVCLDYKKLALLSKKDLELIRDSKTLSLAQRKSASVLIFEIALDYATASASSEEIEQLGIVPATFLAMKRALRQLKQTPELVLIDGRQTIPDLSISQQAIIKGDSLTYCIAAASILAKLERDAFMVQQDKIFPGYHFASHVGYGTKAHLQALSEFGPTPIHRKNFAPITQMLNKNSL